MPEHAPDASEPVELESAQAPSEPYKRESDQVNGRNVELLFYRHGDGSVTCRVVRGFVGIGEAHAAYEARARTNAMLDANSYARR